MNRKIFKIMIVFSMILIISNISFAAKEDLLLPSEDDSRGTIGSGFTNTEINEAGEFFDKNGDGRVSVEEVQEKINSGKDKDKVDKYVTILRVLSNEDESKNYDSNIKWVYEIYTDEDGTKKTRPNVELAEALRDYHNKRRKEEGLSQVSDTFIDEEMNISKYYAPDKSDKGTSAGSNIDDAIEDAKDFLDKAEDDIATISESNLEKFSNAFYNIFLTIGTALAVIIGMVIGIKYMAGSIEAKADIKQMLVPYVVGCIVVFGSFGIWKLILEIISKV